MSFFSSLFAKKTTDQNKFEVLDVKSYKEAVTNKDVQLVDVRTAREFHSGHLAKAVNIDYYQSKKFTDYFGKLNKEQPVYLYCRSGQRSAKAARKLIDMGFVKIYDLKGGILNWI